MLTGSAELANELKTLRKGRGLQTARLTDQVGPLLLQLCGAAGTENTAAIRDRLSERLRILSDRLPEDLRLAVTIALGLHPDTKQPFLQDRVQFLADLQKRDVRTIRRRMDEGFDLLAEMATKPDETAVRGSGLDWYIDRVEAILRMDKPSPVCFERRRIVAERDGLDQIQVMFTLPRDQHRAADEHDLYAELSFGATLLATDRKSDNRFDFQLGLPEPLATGDRHEYGMRWGVPPNQPMRTHYVFFPDRRCDEFRLRIRFDRDRRPSTVWRVTEVFHREIDDNRPTDDLLTIDKAGEINLLFRDLRPGHGYGAQWLPD
ncbi:MAG TPA: hypothetical protein VFX16_21570 [Pseudonocardiaceae bacterium]|nr:hypothetical protein [Pseudonocardiaceae bacterium]